MTDITRVFDYNTRAIKNVERKYSGQMFDANATTIHFEYDPINFLAYDKDYIDPETGLEEEHWIPYIMFAVQDEEGNFLVYGPDATTSQPIFDGYTFTIPWDVTSRVEKSRRVDYQLWFVKNTVDFDPDDGVAHLKSTDYILSEKDCIVIKPSIECKRKVKSGCPATAPSSEPDVIGYINLWKDTGIVSPVRQTVDEDGKPKLKFKTYSGKKNMEVVLDVAPLVKGEIEGEQKEYVPTKFLPVGHTAGTVPLIVGDIGNGRTLVYNETLGGFVDGSAITPEGTVSAERLTEMALDPVAFGLRNGVVYNCRDAYEYQGDTYKAGTNWIWEYDDEELHRGHWEPLTAGEDLDKYQLKEYRVSEWQAQPDDEHYPSEKLVKDEFTAVSGRIAADEQEIDALEGRMDTAESDITGLKADVSALEGDVSTISARITADEARITANETAIGGLGDRATALEGRMDTAESDIQANAEAITGLDARLDTAEGEIQTNAQGIAGNAQAISDLSGTVSSINEGLSALSDTVNNLRAVVSNKTDKTQAIPVWDESVRYPLNATVLYADSIFISIQDDNLGNEPTEQAWWTQISGQGGGGGGVRKKSIQFGDDTHTEYTLTHNLGSYDFLWSIRTNGNERRYVFADVYATSNTSVRVVLSEPPGVRALTINLMDIGVTSSGTNIENISIASPSAVWEYDNNTGKAVFVQTFAYDEAGGYYDEIRGDVRQESASGFTPVTDTFREPKTGEMLIAKTELVREFENASVWTFNHDLAEYVAVQCYRDGVGMAMGNVTQDGNTVVVDWGTAVSGYMVLVEPSLVMDLSNEAVKIVNHNLGRIVGVQLYTSEYGQVMADVHQNGTNIAMLELNAPLTGKIIII